MGEWERSVRQSLGKDLRSVEVQMELNEASSDAGVCVRAGCNKPAVDSQDWDREYCSNQCVVTHCRDIFMASLKR